MISEASRKLVVKAARAGWPEEDIALAVKYSEHLNNSGLPTIFDVEHLSRLSGFSRQFLYAAANGQGKFYRKFSIKKRDGSERDLVEPLPDLKSFQRWFDELVGVKLSVSKYVHSYRVGRSIKTNARFHLGQDLVVRLDVRDFFGSTTVTKVRNLIYSVGYTKSIAHLISNLVTLDGSLPQGAPSSPSISNAIYRDFDERVGAYSSANGWRYTRYADDLTFSGSGCQYSLISKVGELLDKEGLVLNYKKIRVMRRSSRQISCGVVLNDLLGPTRNMRRDFLQEVYFIKKYGLAGHIDRRGIDTPNYLETLIGRGAHIIWMMSQHPNRQGPYKKAVAFLKSASQSSGSAPD